MAPKKTTETIAFEATDEIKLTAAESKLLLAIIGQMNGVPEGVDFNVVANQVGIKHAKNATASAKKLFQKLKTATIVIDEDGQDVGKSSRRQQRRSCSAKPPPEKRNTSKTMMPKAAPKVAGKAMLAGVKKQSSSRGQSMARGKRATRGKNADDEDDEDEGDEEDVVPSIETEEAEGEKTPATFHAPPTSPISTTSHIMDTTLSNPRLHGSVAVDQGAMLEVDTIKFSTIEGPNINEVQSQFLMIGGGRYDYTAQDIEWSRQHEVSLGTWLVWKSNNPYDHYHHSLG